MAYALRTRCSDIVQQACTASPENDHDHESTQIYRRRSGRCGIRLARPRRFGRSRAVPIKIGAFGPMSGNAAAQGQSIRESVEMVVNLKNSAGGLLGRPIEVVIGDDAGKPEEAAVVARRLATPRSGHARHRQREQPGEPCRGAGISRGRGAADRGERDCSTHHDAGQRVGVPLRGAGPQARRRHGRLHQRENAEAQALRIPLRQRRLRQGRLRRVRRRGQEVRHERHVRGAIFPRRPRLHRAADQDPLDQPGRARGMVALHGRRAHPSPDQADGMGSAAVRFRRHRRAGISRSCQGRRQRRHLSHSFQPGDVIEPAGRAGLHRADAQDLQQAAGLRSRRRRSTRSISRSRRSSEPTAATAPRFATPCARPTIRACAGHSSSIRKAIRRWSPTWCGSSTSKKRTRAAEGEKRDDYSGQIGHSAPARQL